jgi:hypothetical protein
MTFIRLLAAASLALMVHAALAVEPLAWSAEGRPSAHARQALALLSDAATHGLDPGDYDAEGLAQAAGRLGRQGVADPAAVAAFDRLLTAAWLRACAAERLRPRGDTASRHGSRTPRRRGA